MSNPIRFDDQVVIVTGAGGGLGKTYALLFASRGAKVVVNDLGGTSKGEGNDTRAADIVVNEIRAAGGVAAADYNSVEDGEKIVQTALDNFGRIDVLVNNAGILRDRSFARISDNDWDLIHRVHLRGSFLVSRAAFPHMKNQNYGRIIMTSSVAGIYGNFGQANYSAAKLGLVGLSNTLAIEGRKYNINCNTIAPMGGTRLTQGILPPDLFEELKPELIAPLVLWLCNKNCEETGGLYEAAGGWFGKYRWERSKGFTCRNSIAETVTPEAVRENWNKITSFDDPLYISSNNEAAAVLAMTLEELKTKSSKIELTPRSAITTSTGPMAAVGITVKDVPFTYNSKDVILYALGVGASLRDKDGLQFLFEGSEGFSPLPTFVIVPAQEALMGSGFLFNIPGWNIDFTKLLHGEQYVELLKPIPSSGTLKSNVTVVDVLDKGTGAVIVADVDTFDESNTLVAKSQWVIFVVGDGGFGGPRKSNKQIPLTTTPTRMPDAVDIFVTPDDLAALYRLSGDKNPLHIDNNFAAMGGFQQPILHGLCSYGVAARAILREFCNNDVSKFRAIKSRFAKPVIPGQTLVTSMWKEENRVYFETSIKENSKICLSGGFVDIVDSEAHVAKALRYSKNQLIRSDPILQRIASQMGVSAELPAASKRIVLWNITLDGKLASQWTFDFINGPSVYQGPPNNNQKPDTVFTLEDSVLYSILIGDLSPQKAFLTGAMKLAGTPFNFKQVLSVFVPQSNL